MIGSFDVNFIKTDEEDVYKYSVSFKSTSWFNESFTIERLTKKKF